MSAETVVKPAHREILRLLAERQDERMPEPGMLTSSATFADRYNVWIHWRTAEALYRAGLTWYPCIAMDVVTVALTEAGWAAAGVERAR